MYDILDHVNHLRLEANEENKQMNEFQLRFTSEIVKFLYEKLSNIKNEKSYKFVVISNLSFIIMVPSFSKNTKKTTINFKEIASVTIFECLSKLLTDKFDKDT